jgi:hypothetical protein
MGLLVRARVLELVDRAQPLGRRDRLQDLETMLLVVPGRSEAPLRSECFHAGQMSVELGGEEAHPPHLALDDDIGACVLLVSERHVDRVVLDLADIARPELTALGHRHRQVKPTGVRVRADDRRAHAGRRIGGFRGCDHPSSIRVLLVRPLDGWLSPTTTGIGLGAWPRS